MLKRCLFLVLLAIFLSANSVFADTFTSTNFNISHPVVTPGSFSSSGSFRMFGSFYEPVIGLSTSNDPTLNTLKAGFLYFSAPSAQPTPTPTPSPTPGGGGPILDIFKKLFEQLLLRCKKTDLNCDRLVNLYDAGIMFYWWEKPIDRPNFASLIASILSGGRPSPDINSDKSVNIFDLSILLSDWD